MRIAPDARIVVLTGAGISAESGIPTFRGSDGLWEGWRLEDVATPQAFVRDPDLVQRLYDMRRRALLAPAVAPNAAHLALARLERAWIGEVLVVTQNIDDLHERAGSRNLVHMHGELLKARCLACDATWPCRHDMVRAGPCPVCGVADRARPHVVWFGEIPLALDRITTALHRCDLFVSIGTSGVVYPAAGFVAEVSGAGRAHTIEIDLVGSAVSAGFAECRCGRAAELVPRLVEELLSAAP
jgi:NAD-dependent deacetylase